MDASRERSQNSKYFKGAYKNIKMLEWNVLTLKNTSCERLKMEYCFKEMSTYSLLLYGSVYKSIMLQIIIWIKLLEGILLSLFQKCLRIVHKKDFTESSNY